MHAYVQYSKTTQRDNHSRSTPGRQSEQSRPAAPQSQTTESSVSGSPLSYDFATIPLHANTHKGVQPVTVTPVSASSAASASEKLRTKALVA